MNKYIWESKFSTLVLILLFSLFTVYSCKQSTKINEGEDEKSLDKEMVNDSSDSKLAILEYKIPSKLGEGAFWNYNSNELYWVDIEGRKVNIYNPSTKENKAIEMPSRVGTIVPKSDTEVVVALEDGIYILDTTTEDLKLLSNIEKDLRTNRFNDGKCDPSGRLWVGSMALDQSPKAASLYMVDKNGQATKKLDSISISNGIVWSRDKKTMFYIDTPTAKIRAFDYNDNEGSIANERVVVDVKSELGYPDGMAIDNQDNLWVGMWNGNAVLCFDSVSGEIIDKIEVPAHNVTSCAFGGPNLKTLYITTASVDMSDEEMAKFPLAGSLFKIDLDIKGVKSTFFGNE